MTDMLNDAPRGELIRIPSGLFGWHIELPLHVKPSRVGPAAELSEQVFVTQTYHLFRRASCGEIV